MKVEIVEESSLLPVLFGLGLSYGLTSGYASVSDLTCEGPLGHLRELAYRLASAPKQGERKFLRQIHVVLDVTAPRYWWVEFDQHKIGTVTQSESTMHSLMNRPIEADDFEGGVMLLAMLDHLRLLQEEYAETQDPKIWRELISFLPQSYLQRRIVTTNYAQLQNIVAQRLNHKLVEWRTFINHLHNNLKYYYLIFGEKECG